MSQTRRSRTTVGILAALVAAILGAPPATADGGPAASYTDALVKLSEGEATQALEELVALELREAPAAGGKEVERLGAAQLRLARRLARSSAESLVPLALLHERAYRAHLDASNLHLAIHSRQHAVELIELYATTSKHPDAGRLAADLLTSLGGYLQEASMVSAAIEIYARALELDPANEAALLGLSGLLERQGSYERAIAPLETLLRQRPEHREARLRLGINLLRLDRRFEGQAVLAGLRDTARPDWILSLAYQELARLEEGDGQLFVARQLLAEARDLLPEDPSLPVQIAYLTERMGAREAPDELASALRSGARSSYPSPRSLYSRVRGRALEDLRASVDDRSRERLEQLADALDRPRRVTGASP